MSLPQPPVLEHCYRHPNREAGRRCTRCGRPACSDCLVQASVGSHCLDCAKAARPDVKTRAKFWNARQPTLVTYVIIAVNVAVFVWMAAADSGTMGGDLTKAHAQLGLDKQVLQFPINFRIIGLDYASEPHEWYRLVTSGFIHFGPFHILMNMFLLFQLGQLLEPALGRVRFGLLYAAGLLGGSLGVIVLDGQSIQITGGASGAVFGLMAGAAIGLHRRGVNVFSTGIGTTLLLNLVLTFTIRNISIGGHLGGAVAGAVCGFFMLAPNWRPTPAWATYALPAGIAIGSAVVGIALAS